MHFLGDAGSKRLGSLKDDDSVAAAFPGQAKTTGNKTLFYNKDGSEKTKSEFMQGINSKLNTAARDFGISDTDIVTEPKPDGATRLFKPSQQPAAQA